MWIIVCHRKSINKYRSSMFVSYTYVYIYIYIYNTCDDHYAGTFTVRLFNLALWIYSNRKWWKRKNKDRSVRSHFSFTMNKNCLLLFYKPADFIKSYKNNLFNLKKKKKKMIFSFIYFFIFFSFFHYTVLLIRQIFILSTRWFPQR